MEMGKKRGREFRFSDHQEEKLARTQVVARLTLTLSHAI
jgi:hypothetical protein